MAASRYDVVLFYSMENPGLLEGERQEQKDLTAEAKTNADTNLSAQSLHYSHVTVF